MSDETFDFAGLHDAISALRAKQVFFVGGAIKSGTTWLQLLLDAHPDISCRGEGHLPNQLGLLLQDALERQNEYISQKNESVFNELKGYPQFTRDHFCYLLASAIALLLHEQSRTKTARAIGEKTPNNIRFLEVLDTLFPAAKFIQIIRDGRDCAVSGWFHNMRVRRDEFQNEYQSLDDYAMDFIDIWRVAVSEGSAFGVRHPTRYLALRYEDLIADPEGTLKGTCEFLGVDCSTKVVSECCAQASFETISGRSRGQEDRRSFFRKGIVGESRHLLGEQVKREFEERAGEWLRRFGYPCNEETRSGKPSEVAFENALSLHQQGKFVEAEQLYRVVLKTNKRDFHALFNLGTMRAQQRRFDDAMRFLKQALAVRPDHVETQNNLRIVMHARDEKALARGDEVEGNPHKRQRLGVRRSKRKSRSRAHESIA